MANEDYSRGKMSEEHVGKALDFLMEQGKIRGYRQTKKYSLDDRRGVDYFIFTDGPRIPLQVKSCHRAMRRHYAYAHDTHKPKVPCVVGKGGIEGLAKLIYRLVVKYAQDIGYGNASG